MERPGPLDNVGLSAAAPESFDVVDALTAVDPECREMKEDIGEIMSQVSSGRCGPRAKEARMSLPDAASGRLRTSTLAQHDRTSPFCDTGAAGGTP